MATDLMIRDRALRAFRRGRWKAAWTASAPVWAVIAFASWFTWRPSAVWIVGAGLAAAFIGMVYLGGAIRRGALPGLAAGLLPLVAAIGAGGWGSECGAGECASWCVPVCVSSGVACGLVLAWTARTRRWSPATLLSAGWLAVLTGAMGCSCVGFAGAFGMAGGLLLPTAAWAFLGGRRLSA
jgi:hypothetical protein